LPHILWVGSGSPPRKAGFSRAALEDDEEAMNMLGYGPAEEAEDGVVLLTGAGASRHIGLPTLDGVLNEASLTLSHQEIGELIWDLKKNIEAGRAASAVFEELVAALKFYLTVADLLKSDDLFTNRLGQLPHAASTGHFKRIWQQALTVCYRMLLDVFGPNDIHHQSEGFQTYVELLRQLAELNGGRLHVYTTNYDCAYQVMASQADSLSFFTHISNEDGKFYERWYCARTDIPQAELPQVYIHRLHGCVAWFTHDSPYSIREIYGAGDSLKVEDERLLHQMCIKLVTSQEIGTNVAFLTAFQEFYEHLRSARALLVWGFSFRDLEVLRAVNHAFAMRQRPLPIYYIDPYLSENRVVNNIRNTLSIVPVKIAPEFRPRQIFWYPNHGEDELVRRTVETLRKSILEAGDEPDKAGVA
jgi:hypothetical protein